MKGFALASCIISLAIASIVFAQSDVSGFDIRGFQLGMSDKDIMELDTTIVIKENRTSKFVTGYLSVSEEVRMRLTSDTLGKRVDLILMRQDL